MVRRRTVKAIALVTVIIFLLTSFGVAGCSLVAVLFGA